MNLDVPGAQSEPLLSWTTSNWPSDRPEPLQLVVSRAWVNVTDEAFLAAVIQSVEVGARWDWSLCTPAQISLRGDKEIGDPVRVELYYVTAEDKLFAMLTAGDDADLPGAIDESCDPELLRAAGILDE